MRPAGTFTLLMRKRTAVTMAPFASLQVPVSFAPLSIEEKRATVSVRASYKRTSLNWVFPLRGVVNAPPYPKAFPFRCKAKTSARKVVELPLRNLAGLSGPETFTHELICPPSMEGLISKSLSINPVEPTITDPNQPVRFQVVFEPLRPFSTSATLVIVRGTGGRWPFEIQLDAVEPDPDDNIVIEANLRTTSSVAFRLTNRYPAYAPFQAFFSTDSAMTLQVHPSTGLLGPEGTQGTVFTVQFSPVEYGKLQRGRLVIQTEDIQWSYEVTGTHPHVLVPQNVESRVESRLETHVASQLGKHRQINAVKRNMTATALQAGRERLLDGGGAQPSP